MLDHEGSGQEERPAHKVKEDLKQRLEKSGWQDRAQVLVLTPELETWVWSDSPHVPDVLGWAKRRPSLRQWLRDQGRWPESRPKPSRPKECLEVVLREVRVRRSSAIYRQLAERVGLERCQDPAFLEFKQIVQRWFPGNAPP